MAFNILKYLEFELIPVNLLFTNEHWTEHESEDCNRHEVFEIHPDVEGLGHLRWLNLERGTIDHPIALQRALHNASQTLLAVPGGML